VLSSVFWSCCRRLNGCKGFCHVKDAPDAILASLAVVRPLAEFPVSAFVLLGLETRSSLAGAALGDDFRLIVAIGY
jgi:hypothetical protein